MSKYLRKINFQNQTITSLVKSAIDTNSLCPPTSRPYLESRKQFKMQDGKMQYTGDQQDKKFSEIARRLDRAIQLHGTRVKSFVQYSLTLDLEQTIINELPLELSKLNPNIAVQVITGGMACTPHKDHSKNSSMFYLYTEPDVKTVWWDKKTDFEEFDDFKYGDPDELYAVHEEVIETGSWYIFNNNEFHSIHLLENKIINRIALLFEFNIFAEDLYKLFNNE